MKTREREIVYPISDESETHDIIVALRMVVEYLETFNMDKLQREAMKIAANRLEQLERERDAAVNDLRFLGKNGHTCRARKICIMREIDQSTCIDCKMWHWRGLPQDGEKK